MGAPKIFSGGNLGYQAKDLGEAGQTLRAPTPAPNNVTASLRGGGDSRGVCVCVGGGVPLYLPIVSLMIPTYKSGLAAAKAAARPILNFPQVRVCTNCYGHAGNRNVAWPQILRDGECVGVPVKSIQPAPL